MIEPEPTSPGANRGTAPLALRAVGTTVAVVAVILLGINLRFVFGSASAVIEEITAAYRLGPGSAALLTTGPVVCLGLFAPVAARSLRRWSVPTVLTGCLALLAIGTAIRGLPSWPALVTGTMLAGIGIAVANVLGPVLVRLLFTHRIGLMTGLLTALISASAGIASGATIPFADNVVHSWRLTLLAWATPAVLAVAAMAVVAARQTRHTRSSSSHQFEPAPRWQRAVLTSRVAWAVTVFMGLQSLLAYALIGWLPTIYRDRGLSSQSAGLLLTTLSVSSICTALTVPIWATKMSDQRRVALAVTGLSVVGLIGVISGGTSGGFVWAALLGLGQGGQLSLALTMMNLRSASASTTASLSTMAQSIGYLIAATGPLVVALLHGATGDWTAPVGFLLALMVPLGLCGWLAGANRFVLIDEEKRGVGAKGVADEG